MKMIGLFLLTHVGLGEALVYCATHVLGERPPKLLQLGVMAQDDPATLMDLAHEMLNWVKSDGGVLVMTDLYGSTPSNLATSMRVPGEIEVVAGVSLPLLITALNYRSHYSLPELVTKVLDGGHRGLLAIPPQPAA